MKRLSLFVSVCLILANAYAQSSADSVTITFRAHKGAGTPVALPGQFSGWSTGNAMSYDASIGAWTKTYTFKIHDASRAPLGDSVYQYKFHDGSWYADPLNPEQNPNDHNNSVLRMTNLFYFQFYSEEAASNVNRIVVGIVHRNSDTIASVKFYTGTNASSATMTDVTSAFIKDKRLLNYTLASPVPKTNYMKVVATTDKGDSIVYQNSVYDVQQAPVPVYAKHGVTKASQQSGDSTTFRIRVPGKSFVVLRLAYAGQPVATAPPLVMKKDPVSDNWWLNVKLDPDTSYEYVYEIENGKKITDPWGRQVGTFGSKFSTGSSGLTADNYIWQAVQFERPPLNQLVIYELNVGEFAGGYFGKPAGFEKRNGEETGFNTMIYSESEVKRIAESAFDIARKRKKKVCSVDKANILEVSQLWRKVVTDVAMQYPDVELSHMYVDNCSMQLIRNPKQFDVIVTENMFGDILSDEAAMLTGSIGMLASASLGGNVALYEPVHGSAPDIAGQNKANPIATIASVAMMLRYSFNRAAESDAIENAIEKVLSKGFRTGDIFTEGTILLGTKEMTQKISESL